MPAHIADDHDTPLARLSLGLSNALFGFSVFLVIAGLIGVVFVFRDIQESKQTFDVRSDASTAETTVDAEPVIVVPECRDTEVCTDQDANGNPTSCITQTMCEAPEGCHYEDVPCEPAICSGTDCSEVPACNPVLICTTQPDDIFFADITQLNSPEFFSDETRKTPIQESELKEGKTYYFTSTISLQNAIKTSTQSDVAFPVTVITNGITVPAAEATVPYFMLTNHQDGYQTQVEGLFVAKPQNEFLFSIVTLKQGTTLVTETTYSNNTHSHTFSAATCTNNPDLNGDSKVDIRDFSILNREFLTEKTNYTADITCDNKVDIRDYAVMAGAFDAVTDIVVTE